LLFGRPSTSRLLICVFAGERRSLRLMPGFTVTKCPQCKGKRSFVHQVEDYDDDCEWYCDKCEEKCDNDIGYAHCEPCWGFQCHKCYRKKHKALPTSAMRALKARGDDDEDEADATGKKAPRKKLPKAAKRKAIPLASISDVSRATMAASMPQTALRALIGIVADGDEAVHQPLFVVARAAYRRALAPSATTAGVGSRGSDKLPGHQVSVCPDCDGERRWQHVAEDDEYDCTLCGDKLDDEVGIASCRSCWDFVCHNCYRKSNSGQLPDSALLALADKRKREAN
jgi:hypothetical protein